MSTNLATILVGLGYDLSALEKGAPEAFNLINKQTLGMSAEMKRASREGAESWRLIDEALGIHLSRPLTRLVTQEFPAFASAMQSVLGAGVVGALGVAGIEFFDKLVKKIEEARAAQEHYAEASANVDRTISNVLGGIDRKILETTTKDHTLHIRLAGADEAKTGIDQIAKAFDALQTAQEKANGFWTRLAAGAGDFAAHVGEGLVDLVDLVSVMNSLYSSNTPKFHDAIFGSQELSNMKTTLKDMRENFNEALDADKFKGTHEALTLAQRDIQIATAYLGDMQKAGDKAGIAIAQAAVEFYKSSAQVEGAVSHLEGAQISAERQQAAATAISDLYRSMRESLSKLAPETDPLKKLSEEIRLMKQTAEQEFAELGKNSDSALQLRGALSALESYESKLDAVFAKAKANADVLKAQEGLPTKIAATPSLPTFATPVAPVLGAGGTAGAQFDTFLKDQPAQLKLAAQAYQDLLTPQDKFQVTQTELNLLLKEGLIHQDAYTAALQRAREEMTKATDQLTKLLEKTDSAQAGFQAFLLQLENQAGKSGTGAFTFDILNKGLQGFEDETAKALTGAKTNWKSFFDSLDQMALKFVLNKEFASLFKMLSDSSLGKSLGLGGLLGAGANPSQIANTTALTTNTAAITALTATMTTQSATGGVGGASAIANPAGLLGMIPGFAEGTDFAPGGLSLVGENGPELLNLPSGSSVTPHSAMRAAPPTVHVNIDARGAQMGVAEQIARSWEQNGPMMVTRAVVEAQESSKRSLSQK